MSSMDPLMIATGLLKLLVNVMNWMLILVHPAMKIAKEIFEPPVSLAIYPKKLKISHGIG